ncbi:ATP-binding protein [Dechloromonas sp. A34]|uniref:ATP-binding protein n=1 Tax=Dechloromonas sp. A34 TaxID=447588 RepID=UPI002249740C|nr:ATP-binding protein [Dechloromonas sp. A34]
MGRLFWKFFLCIWLAQLAAVLGTGALFWMERQPGAANLRLDGHPPPDFHERPPPEFAQARPPRPPHGLPPSGPLPLLPVIAGLFASLLCAGGLAWYFAKPIRHLRNAFEAAAGGDLAVRVTPSMGGRRDELADLGHDFDRMTAQLQAVIDGQKRLLHDVSHEMRSPLARLQAAIGLARQQPGRTEDSLQRIAREGERIDQLVGELLTLSRLEAGVTGELENVELGELLANIAEDARFEGAARGITIDFVAGATAEVRANPELLHRALENVVRNALRYSPAGGVVQIAGQRTDNQVFRITITDQGPGVAAADLEAIFTPFFRSEGQGAAGGYGLGLAIARRAIAALAGQINARNGSAGGLIVDIKLPL